MPIIDKEEKTFRDPYIFASDAKAIILDNVLVNLFMLMRNNGARIKLMLRAGKFHDIKSLKRYFQILEERTDVKGYSDNPDAIESWLRSSLVNMVFRGKAKENVASMRPLHLESYRIRNQRHTRDYNSADQIFIMLNQRPEVMKSLKDYLSVGWDNASRKLVDSPTLDVDTAGILHLIKLIDIDTKASSSQIVIKPLLEKQANLFCDDIMRLLAYQHNIPRSVFIDYLRILVGFHLSLYFQKLVYLLPKMVKEGTIEVVDDWSQVVDMTDKLESDVAPIACADMNITLNGLIDYIRASYSIRVMRRIVTPHTSVATALSMIKNPTLDINANINASLRNVYNKYYAIAAENQQEAEQNVKDLQDYLQFEETPLDKYVQCLMKVGAAYQLKFSRDFLDKASMKNEASALIIDGRSRKHPRRGAIGSKLLEVMVQLLVLNQSSTGVLESRPLSIRQLAKEIRERYGLIIDGTDEIRFKDADIKTHLAFKENMSALKNKLRQIGFYTDLSDASSLQKIRPRYKFNY
ncbi:MAG: hypothetical protein LUC91_07780 [Prevotella sp.]|nr:hypothetical protein [Prevotella sp.]